MKKSQRAYVSSHVYKTPAGLYYDDRTGKRLTRIGGENRGKLHARARDKEGHFGHKRIKVNSDIRKKGEKHTGSPDSEDSEVSTIYDPIINEELALEYARTHLDIDEPTYEHFNLEYTGEVET